MTAALKVIARLFGCCVRRVHVGKLAISGDGPNGYISITSNKNGKNENKDNKKDNKDNKESVEHSSVPKTAPDTPVRKEEVLELNEDKSVLEEFANAVCGVWVKG